MLFGTFFQRFSYMASDFIFTDEDINQLLETNSLGALGARNAALIMGAVCWGITTQEMCRVTTREIMSAAGEFYTTWEISKISSFNDETRTLYTSQKLKFFLSKYVELRIANNWFLSNDAAFRTLSPDEKFFLNDQGEPYKETPRKNSTNSFQPRSMNEQLKRMIGRTQLVGATPGSFRDSFIKNMYEKGCSFDDLMLVTGIKQKRTLETKVRPRPSQFEEALNKIFSEVRIPDVLK
jgi:integrase